MAIEKSEAPDNLNIEILREHLVKEGLKYVGYKATNYSSDNNGISPETGFDCSGFVTFLLKKIGFPLPQNIRHTNQYNDFFGIPVHFELRKAGDLVIFSFGKRKGIAPSHIGILIDRDNYVHSRGRDGTVVEIEKLKEKLIPSVSGQIYCKNPIAIKRLSLQGNNHWQQI